MKSYLNPEFLIAFRRLAFRAKCGDYNEGANPVDAAQSPDIRLFVFRGIQGCSQLQVYQVDGTLKPIKVATSATQGFAFSPDGWRLSVAILMA